MALVNAALLLIIVSTIHPHRCSSYTTVHARRDSYASDNEYAVRNSRSIQRCSENPECSCDPEEKEFTCDCSKSAGSGRVYSRNKPLKFIDVQFPPFLERINISACPYVELDNPEISMLQHVHQLSISRAKELRIKSYVLADIDNLIIEDIDLLYVESGAFENLEATGTVTFRNVHFLSEDVVHFNPKHILGDLEFSGCTLPKSMIIRPVDQLNNENNNKLKSVIFSGCNINQLEGTISTVDFKMIDNKFQNISPERFFKIYFANTVTLSGNRYKRKPLPDVRSSSSSPDSFIIDIGKSVSTKWQDWVDSFEFSHQAGHTQRSTSKCTGIGFREHEVNIKCTNVRQARHYVHDILSSWPHGLNSAVRVSETSLIPLVSYLMCMFYQLMF